MSWLCNTVFIISQVTDLVPRHHGPNGNVVLLMTLQTLVLFGITKMLVIHWPRVGWPRRLSES